MVLAAGPARRISAGGWRHGLAAAQKRDMGTLSADRSGGLLAWPLHGQDLVKLEPLDFADDFQAAMQDPIAELDNDQSCLAHDDQADALDDHGCALSWFIFILFSYSSAV